MTPLHWPVAALTLALIVTPAAPRVSRGLEAQAATATRAGAGPGATPAAASTATSTTTAAAAEVASATATATADDLVTYRITPQDTDATIGRFNEPHLVIFDRHAPASANLLLFMPGTGGRPTSVSDFLHVAVTQGYRAVALSYNDVPAVIAICGRDPNSDCSGKVRHKRIFGEDVTGHVDDTPAESIVNRLAKLLALLDRDHPDEGWGQYLENSAPKWERIVAAGHSQGAGMAAYLAQRKRVARVVLFSSPWDFYGRNRQLAPWVLEGPGVTPSDRWFGAYHKRENTAAEIARAYKGLKIPDGHVRAFALEPARAIGENPNHLSVVGNATTPRDPEGTPAYASDWRFLLGPS
jgi:acetyl esterase/lipase